MTKRKRVVATSAENSNSVSAQHEINKPMNEPKTEAKEWTEDDGYIYTTIGKMQRFVGRAFDDTEAQRIIRHYDLALATLRRELADALDALSLTATNEATLRRDLFAAQQALLTEGMTADQLRRELEEAQAKLTEFGAPIGDEHSTFSLAERITGMGISKDYAWRELDKARTRLAQAKADTADAKRFAYIVMNFGPLELADLENCDGDIGLAREWVDEAINKTRGLPEAQEQGKPAPPVAKNLVTPISPSCKTPLYEKEQDSGHARSSHPSAGS